MNALLDIYADKDSSFHPWVLHALLCLQGWEQLFNDLDGS